MGDRANIAIRQSDDTRVYLYTHWGGHDLPFVLRKALSKRMRWNDPAYLARIIFCQLVNGHEEQETGFGISTMICDNDCYPILLVDSENQTIQLLKYSWKDESGNLGHYIGESLFDVSIENFITDNGIFSDALKIYRGRT